MCTLYVKKPVKFWKANEQLAIKVGMHLAADGLVFRVRKWFLSLYVLYFEQTILVHGSSRWLWIFLEKVWLFSLVYLGLNLYRLCQSVFPYTEGSFMVPLLFLKERRKERQVQENESSPLSHVTLQQKIQIQEHCHLKSGNPADTLCLLSRFM